jgi:hypothetical protein
MEDHDQTEARPEPEAPLPPDPRLMAVQEAADALKAACQQLPDTDGRMHALAHVGAVPIYAAQAIREEGQGNG